jgi:hypothetical protein
MQIEVKLAGITPLIMNSFHDAAAQAATNGTRSSAAGADRGTPQEIAAKKIYRDLDGRPCIPQPNLIRCIVDGGTYHKVGKSQVTTQAKSMLFGCMDIPAATIPLEHRQEWVVDTRAVVVPATKGRILAFRPMFHDWALSFVIDLDATICSPKLLRQIVDDAGQRVGLGDFRPARKGPYGRFRVDSWQEVEPQLNAAA